MGTRGKINAFWCNIKINLQNIGRYNVDINKLPTNLQNFTQKDITEVKISRKVLGGYFFVTACISRCALRHKWQRISKHCISISRLAWPMASKYKLCDVPLYQKCQVGSNFASGFETSKRLLATNTSRVDEDGLSNGVNVFTGYTNMAVTNTWPRRATTPAT